MLADNYKHQLGSFLNKQGTALLARQRAISEAYYGTRTSSLARALSGTPTVTDLKVSVPYPKHIRFLDMKKTRLGKRKKKYAAIYNRYVYGYLKSPVYRLLMASLPDQIIKTIEDTVTTIKK